MNVIFRSNIALDYVCLLDGMILFSSLTVLIVWLTEKHSTQNKKTGMDFYTRYTRCIYRWERTLLKTVGHDILSDEFKKNILSYFIYFWFVLPLVINYILLFTSIQRQKSLCYTAFLWRFRFVLMTVHIVYIFMRIYNKLYLNVVF